MFYDRILNLYVSIVNQLDNFEEELNDAINDIIDDDDEDDDEKIDIEAQILKID